MAETSIPQDSSSSKSLLWMMIALFCGLGILLGGGIFTASRVLRSMQFRAMGEKLTVHTPAADLRVEKTNEVGPGLPIYPHASLVLPGENVGTATPGGNQAEVQAVTYHTNDIRDIVESWYLGHLGAEFVRHDAGDKVFPEAFREARISDDYITFVGERSEQVRIAAMAPDSTGTKITLVRFTKHAGQ